MNQRDKASDRRSRPIERERDDALEKRGGTAVAATAGRFATRWLDSPLWLSVAGNACLWAALPPLRWSVLAWLAPLFWSKLILLDELRGRRPYVAIWLSSAVFWMAVMQGMRLAHWATYIGLVALGLFVGIYLPLFIALARRAVHVWRVPLLLAAPMAWTGVELARGYGPLGFSLATLAHTQVRQLGIIQVADLFGAYTISFIMVFVAAGIFTMLPTARHRWRLWPALPVLAVVILTAAYGKYRLDQEGLVPETPRTIRVALIQGSVDTLFEDNPDRPRETLEQYGDLTYQACSRYQPLDLVVWPESMFPPIDILIDPGVELEIEPSIDRQMIDDNRTIFDQLVRSGVRRINQPDEEQSWERSTHWLLGTTTWQFGDYPTRHYNTALFVDEQGEIMARYYKMHPVMFGEYVPFGEMIPALYRCFPFPMD